MCVHRSTHNLHAVRKALRTISFSHAPDTAADVAALGLDADDTVATLGACVGVVVVAQ